MKKFNEIIIAQFNTWELTLHELLMSCFIVGVLMFIGYCISNTIERHVHNKQLIYRQAAQIDKNGEQFELALNTDIGNAFVEGNIKTIDTVKHPKLNGEWMSIDARYQKYTMHTRVVTYTTTDSKGRSKTHHRTETYWTWDLYKREHHTSNKLKFLGVELPISKFKFNNCQQSIIVDNGYHRRICFTMIPKTLFGTAFMTIRNKSIDGHAEFYNNTSIKPLYEYYTTSYAVTIFWIIWIILIIGGVILFFVSDNLWLH